MAAYVLIHGGGHGGWCYDKVTRLLKAKGHDVYAPSLTGCGDRAHLISAKVDLHLHITDVVNLLRSRDLRDVILVGHSYGGMVITAREGHRRARGDRRPLIARPGRRTLPRPVAAS